MSERIDGRTLRYQHRRGDLLEAVGDYVLENGVARLSLRGAAEAVGVSHGTLKHHFGTKEQLVTEIVEHLLPRAFTPEVDYSDLGTLRVLWARWNSPGGRRDLRLLLEVVGQSLFGNPGYKLAVERSVEQRLELIAARLTHAGCPEDETRARATVVLALLRGLMMDMLATGDRTRLDGAFEIVLAIEAEHLASWAEDSLPESTAGAASAGSAA